MIRTLFEQTGLPVAGLPPALQAAFDGDMGLAAPVLYVNFVTSVDGVAAFSDATPPSAISGGSRSDRFLMGLLRAFADTVLIGAATLRAEPSHVWSPEWICPEFADEFRQLRSYLGLPPAPRLVVLTRSGDLDLSSRALELGALVLTGDAGADRLKNRLPGASTVQSLGSTVSVPEVIELLRREGSSSILSEGGPHVVGQLLRAGAIDEIFLTVSPRLCGRTGTDRLSLVEGVSFEPPDFPGLTLASVKHDAGELFLRYRLNR